MSHKKYHIGRVATAVAVALTANVAANEVESETSSTVFPGYEIVNINDLYTISGTLDNTQNGYGIGIDGELGAYQMIALSKGVNDATASDDSVIDQVLEAILPSEGNTANSIIRQFVANNFLAQVDETTAEIAFVPLYEVNPPVLNPVSTADNDICINPDDSTPRIDSIYYRGINGARLGTTSAEQECVDNPDYDAEVDSDEDGISDETRFYYYREYEARAFIEIDGNPTLVTPPEASLSFTPVDDDDMEVTDATFNVGGFSLAADIDKTFTYATGYASVDFTETTKDYLQGCYDSPGDDGARPIEACVQNLKNNGLVGYQNRAMRWTLSNGEVSLAEELPQGFTPAEDDTNNYISQGLGINEAGYVVGRAYRSSAGLEDEPNLIDSSLWATLWTPADDIIFVGPTVSNSDAISESILEEINNNNYAIGTVKQYINGYERNKFGYVLVPDKLEAGSELTFIEPLDLYSSRSDLSSRARSINDNDQVVGYIEVDLERQLPRSTHGFIYDITNDEFSNINELLTCNSRALIESADGTYSKAVITDSDNFSEVISYETSIEIVDINEINDEGYIAATALVTLPKVLVETELVYDEDGTYQGTRDVIVVGDNGKPVVEQTANGGYATDQVPRSVLLKPTDVADICAAPVTTGLASEPVVRQGAAINPLWCLLSLPLLWWRRRKN